MKANNPSETYKRLQLSAEFINVYQPFVTAMVKMSPEPDEIYEIAAEYFEEKLMERDDDVPDDFPTRTNDLHQTSAPSTVDSDDSVADVEPGLLKAIIEQSQSSIALQKTIDDGHTEQENECEKAIDQSLSDHLRSSIETYQGESELRDSDCRTAILKDTVHPQSHDPTSVIYLQDQVDVRNSEWRTAILKDTARLQSHEFTCTIDLREEDELINSDWRTAVLKHAVRLQSREFTPAIDLQDENSVCLGNSRERLEILKAVVELLLDHPKSVIQPQAEESIPSENSRASSEILKAIKNLLSQQSLPNSTPQGKNSATSIQAQAQAASPEHSDLSQSIESHTVEPRAKNCSGQTNFMYGNEDSKSVVDPRLLYFPMVIESESQNSVYVNPDYKPENSEVVTQQLFEGPQVGILPHGPVESVVISPQHDSKVVLQQLFEHSQSTFLSHGAVQSAVIVPQHDDSKVFTQELFEPVQSGILPHGPVQSEVIVQQPANSKVVIQQLLEPLQSAILPQDDDDDSKAKTWQMFQTPQSEILQYGPFQSAEILPQDDFTSRSLRPACNIDIYYEELEADIRFIFCNAFLHVLKFSSFGRYEDISDDDEPVCTEVESNECMKSFWDIRSDHGCSSDLEDYNSDPFANKDRRYEKGLCTVPSEKFFVNNELDCSRLEAVLQNPSPSSQELVTSCELLTDFEESESIGSGSLDTLPTKISKTEKMNVETESDSVDICDLCKSGNSFDRNVDDHLQQSAPSLRCFHRWSRVDGETSKPLGLSWLRNYLTLRMIERVEAQDLADRRSENCGDSGNRFTSIWSKFKRMKASSVFNGVRIWYFNRKLREMESSGRHR